MRIDNNCAQRQPNFGKLRSITYQRHLNPDVYPEEFAKVLKAIKESKAFNEFFKQYDVDMSFCEWEGLHQQDCVYMKLRTTVPKTKVNNLHPTLWFDAAEGTNELIYSPVPLLID